MASDLDASVAYGLDFAPTVLCLEQPPEATIFLQRKGTMMHTHSLTLGACLMSALLLGIVPGKAAMPGQANASDVKVIDACLADAAKDKTDPDTCIGRISASCADTAAGSSGPIACADREFLVWDAAENRDYLQLSALITDVDIKQALRDAQREFIMSELKSCTFERILHKDTPDSLIFATKCKARATALQDLWLLTQIHSLKGP